MKTLKLLSILGAILIAAAASASPARANTQQIVVQTSLGPAAMNTVCLLRGCQVTEQIAGSPDNFFVLNVSSSVNLSFLTNILQSIPGILKVTPVSGAQNPLGNRYIVRTVGGLLNLKLLCDLHLCQILAPLDGASNSVFLIAGPSNQDPNLFLAILRGVVGVLDAELDQVVSIATGSATATVPPPSLVNTTPVSYYGSPVWSGYANQPAAQIVKLAQTQQHFNVAGSGIIADIDTGVDPKHPVLKPVLLAGYDFTRNQVGGSEMNDLPGGASTTEVPCTNCIPGKVNQRSIAMVDQRSIAMVDSPSLQAFGHGTMVAGILHLVAPKAQLMPLKAFKADGTADLSDILRAVYYAEQNGATVVNMSFDLTTYSNELATAITKGESKGIVFVASSGNDGKMEMVYPAGLTNVMGVASTNNNNQRSTFSNYGNQIVWVAAPGEAIVTTYPFGSYAAGWGTSFSAPLVSGGVSLIETGQTKVTQLQAEFAIAQADLLLSLGMGNGQLDLYRAATSARSK